LDPERVFILRLNVRHVPYMIQKCFLGGFYIPPAAALSLIRLLLLYSFGIHIYLLFWTLYFLSSSIYTLRLNVTRHLVACEIVYVYPIPLSCRYSIYPGGPCYCPFILSTCFPSNSSLCLDVGMRHVGALDSCLRPLFFFFFFFFFFSPYGLGTEAVQNPKTPLLKQGNPRWAGSSRCLLCTL
jgi:hypothetical protein